MVRHGEVIAIKPECIADYVAYHKAVWPEVAAKISACNIQNYSIFLHDGVLFAYYEYTGSDFAADMAKMAADPKTLEWWSVVKPLQSPLASRKAGEWWASMEEVFHQD
jgi:L-rhamnose mutarotase